MKRRFSITVPRQNYYDHEHNKRVATGRICFDSERWPTKQDVMVQCQAHLIGSNQVAYRTHNFAAMIDTLNSITVWPEDFGFQPSSVQVEVQGELHDLTIQVYDVTVPMEYEEDIPLPPEESLRRVL